MGELVRVGCRQGSAPRCGKLARLWRVCTRMFGPLPPHTHTAHHLPSKPADSAAHMPCLGACAVECMFQNHLSTSGGGFVAINTGISNQQLQSGREEVEEAGRARRRAAVVLRWRTVQPAAWLWVAPSVIGLGLEWVAQADAAGGRGQGHTAGCSISAKRKSHPANELPRSVACCCIIDWVPLRHLPPLARQRNRLGHRHHCRHCHFHRAPNPVKGG